MRLHDRPALFEIIRDGLRAGEAITDALFDSVYPGFVRELSPKHWTPVGVAQKAVRLLMSRERPVRLVLDVGSGAGKLCIVGALTTGAVFVGVEQRRWLTEVATRAARRLRAEQSTCFLERDVLAMEWSRYDAVYLFNPFYEHIDEHARIDTRVEMGPELYAKSVLATRERLASLRSGARVVIYHGFGAALPEGFRLERHEKAGSDELELWVRA